MQHATTLDPTAKYTVSRGEATLLTATLDQIRDMLAVGTLMDTDSFWGPGLSDWAPLSDLIPPPAGVSTPDPLQEAYLLAAQHRPTIKSPRKTGVLHLLGLG